MRPASPFSAALVFLALLVLAAASLVTMRLSIRQLRQQRQERLLADAEVLGTSLRDLDPYFVDPEESERALQILRRLNSALGLREVSLVELGERVLLSTSPEVLVGSPEPSLVAFPEQAEAAWAGVATLSPVFRDQLQPFQAAFLPLMDDQGEVATLLVASVDREDFQHLDFLRDSFRGVVLGAATLVLLLLGLSLAIGRRAEQTEQDLEHSRRLSLAGQVAAGVVHEVRNPLGIIRSTVELLRGLPELAEEDRELADEALEEVDRISEVLERFLSLARAGPSEPETVGVGSVLEAVARLARKDLARRGIELELVVESEDDVILVDVRGLRQALLNLVLNARASLEGSSAPEPRIRLSVRDGDEDRLHVEVWDNGPGFPAEVLREPFRAFRTGRPDGTGLGLPLVQRFAQEAGGEAHLGNPARGGALASLVLPRRRKEGGDPASPEGAHG